MSRLNLIAVIAVLVASAAPRPTPAQEPGTAQVSGAEVINLRRGPGLDHPIIGVLHRGQALQVEGSSAGQWVRVRSGDLDGYVNSHFLALPTAPTAAAPTITPASAGSTPPPTATAATAVGNPAVGAGPAAEAAAAPASPLHRDIDRILSMTEAMHRDVKMLQTLQVADPPRDGISGLRSGLGLLLLGAVVGFVVGNIFGRQQGRGTRNRVRF